MMKMMEITSHACVLDAVLPWHVNPELPPIANIKDTNIGFKWSAKTHQGV